VASIGSTNLARSKCLTAALVVLTLLAAVFLGRQPRLLYIALPIGGVAALVLLSRPVIGLGFLIVFAWCCRRSSVLVATSH